MPPGDCIVTPSPPPPPHGCLPTFWLHVQTSWLQDAQCRTLLLSTAAPASSGAVAGASWVCVACWDSYRSTATPASCTAPQRHTPAAACRKRWPLHTALPAPRALATEAGAWKEVHVVHMLLDGRHPQRWLQWPACRAPPLHCHRASGGHRPVWQHTLLSGRSWSWAVRPNHLLLLLLLLLLWWMVCAHVPPCNMQWARVRATDCWKPPSPQAPHFSGLE